MFLIHGLFTTDIITNSSSVVYSEASSPATLHAVFNEVLGLVGHQGKSEDLFDIYEVPSRLEEADEYVDDFFDVFGVDEDAYESASWTERGKMIMEAGLRLIKEGKLDSEMFRDQDSYGLDSSYLVVLKDGTETEIGKRLNGLFDTTASYDG